MSSTMMMKWESKNQPKYVWIGDYWYKTDTKDYFVACHQGWASKRYLTIMPYDKDVIIFGEKRQICA